MVNEPLEKKRLDPLKQVEFNSLRAAFGQNIAAEAIEDGGWRISGQFEEGVNSGGQKFTCSVERQVLTDESSKSRTFWKLNSLIINGYDILQDILAPVYIGIPYYQPDPKKPDQFLDMVNNVDMGIDLAKNRIFLNEGLRTFDNVVGMVHENNHIILAKNYDLDDDLLNKQYRNLTKTINSLANLGQDLRTIIRVTRIKMAKQGTTDLLIKGSLLVYREEVDVNKLTYNYFEDHQPFLQSFSNESDVIRLKKYLTLASLSYSQAANELFGKRVLDPSLAEIK